MQLRIAAKVDAVDREESSVARSSRCSPVRVDFMGEIGEDQKADFFGNARALLFPVDWPEPFGLVPRSRPWPAARR